MKVSDVMDQVGTALESVEGLRVFPYSAERIVPPAALVGWPESVEFDIAMGRGCDRITLPVVVVVGKADARTTRDRLAFYMDGGDEGSVKAALENGSYTAFDSIRVVSASVDGYSVAAVEYLGVEFQLDIIGQGA